ncbi:MAG TPA: C10 family peptidase, partial [Bacteroidales bacterium]|nr:C10 family peptidase [Bacteroidales bacterium]
MKRFYYLLLLSFVALNIYANPVNEEIALKAAKNFILHYSRLKSTNVNLISQEVKTYNNTSTFYAFNNSTGGWILISANDVAIPVLAYSTTGEWNDATVNPTAKLWIESYNKEIYQAIENGQTNEASRQEWDNLLNQQFSDAATTVSPLLATSWDQSKYYNDLCPASTEAPAGYGGHVPTGCVATAMAQIMKYYNYPAQGVGSSSYTHTTYGTLSANYGNTDYNWAAMPVKAATTSAALATLIYHCGVAVKMNYAPDGSGALSGDVPRALTSYFNYDNTISVVAREDVGSDELWRSIIRTELDAKRPVYYSGSGSGGGHAFVCDGYDNSNPTKFHINWGWSGSNNGYFSIGVLTTTNGAFNDLNRIVIGIKPRTNPGLICRIESPANGSNVNQGDDIKVSVKTLKGSSTKIVLLLDGVRIDSTTNPANDFTIKTSNLVNGEHRISIKADDGTNTNDHDIVVNILSTCWKPQNITLSVDSVNVEQIFAVDGNVVWAVLKDMSSKGRLLRKYIKTIDGGATWTEGSVSCTSCSTKDISNIYAFSGSKAYVCLNPGNAANGGAILLTEDGGATWTTQSSADFTNSWANWVYFFDENNGICMGDSYKLSPSANYSFAIYTTSDGGKTWTAVTADKLPQALAGEAGTVNFFDAIGNTIWFGTGSGRVYKSIDKGINWTVKDGVLGAIQTNVRFRDVNNGFAFGRYGYADYGFKKTTDGGTTWVDAFPKGAISGQDYQFVPGTESTWINSGVVESILTPSSSNTILVLDPFNVLTETLMSSTFYAFNNSTGGWILISANAG